MLKVKDALRFNKTEWGQGKTATGCFNLCNFTLTKETHLQTEFLSFLADQVSWTAK